MANDTDATSTANSAQQDGNQSANVNCYECVYYEAARHDCRRHAPTVVVRGDIVFKFPPMQPTEWCGEGVRKDARNG